MVGDSISTPGPDAWIDDLIPLVAAADDGTGHTMSVTWTRAGDSGATITVLNSVFSSTVIPYDPTYLLIEVGINNFGDSPATVTSQALTYIDQARSWKPNLRMGWVSPIILGEAWHLVGGVPTFDVNVDSIVGAIKAACDTRGVDFFDMPPKMLAFQPADNPTQLNSGRQTSDGKHPNALGGTRISNGLMSPGYLHFAP